MELPKTVSIYKCDDLKVMICSRGNTLEEVLEAVECAIRGAGFYLEIGSLTIEEDNNETL